jgi:hypothetical protein
MIRFKCSCGQNIKMADDAAGRYGKYPKCGEKVLIPAAAGLVPDCLPVDFV